MKRFVALMLVLLVSLPWAALVDAEAAARAVACTMPSAMAVESCAYCAPAGPSLEGGATLEAGCCRFLPNQESTPAQAGSLGSTPKPHLGHGAAAIVPGTTALEASLAPHAFAFGSRVESPPPALPTRTTHLLL